VAANNARVAQVLSVDGVDLVNDNTIAGVATLNAGLFPTVAGPHTFSVLDPGATLPRSVTLVAAALTAATVQNVQTLPAPNQHVGYMLFNEHLATSDAELVAAINQLKAAGVTDLGA
jgi:C-terminal processing protease CtpA/Prc